MDDIPFSDVTFLVPSEAIGRQVSDFLKARNFNVKDLLVPATGAVAGRTTKSRKFITKGSSQAKGATIHSYKGLENRAIVAYLPEPGGRSDLHAYYVAITALSRPLKARS